MFEHMLMFIFKYHKKQIKCLFVSLESFSPTESTSNSKVQAKYLHFD